MSLHTAPLLDHPAVTSVLFHPRPDTPGSELPEGSRMFAFLTRDGLRFFVRCHLAAPEAPHILLFHGNGELASDYDDLAPFFLQSSLSLLVCDYRGYGPNPGVPSGSNLLTDALDTFEAIREWLKEQSATGPLYVMGRSLGTAAAMEIAFHHEDRIGGLIFDSAFADTLPLLSRLGVPVEKFGFHEEDGFRHRTKISQFYKPVLFLHGQEDVLTPLEDAQNLHALCPSKKRHLLVIPNAGHNDTFARGGQFYIQTIESFIGHRRSKRRPHKSRSH